MVPNRIIDDTCSTIQQVISITSLQFENVGTLQNSEFGKHKVTESPMSLQNIAIYDE